MRIYLENAERSAYYERTATGAVYRVMKDRDLFGRVVIADLNGNDFAVEPGVLENLYLPVDDVEGMEIFSGSAGPVYDANDGRKRRGIK